MSLYPPLVLVSGRLTQLPAGDALAGVVGTGQTGQFASNAALTATGAALISLISASAAGVGTINGLSGALVMAGAGNVTVTSVGQSLIVSGDTGAYADFATRVDVAATGHSLYELITGISGSAGGGDVTFAQLAATGALLEGQIATLSGYTDGTFATIPNVTATGAALFARDTAISGGLEARIAATGQAGYAAMLGQVVGVDLRLTQTGATLGGRIDSVVTNLTSTGVTLGAKVDSVSGWAASAVNLRATGSNLYVTVTGLSGAHNAAIAATGQAAWTHGQNNALNLSGVLATTGATLGARIDTVTTNLTATGATLWQRDLDISGALAAQIAGGNGTVVKVTGSANLTTADFSGIGGTLVILSGGKVLISGGAGGGGDVTSAQLTSTGVQLGVSINALSGYANATFATITNLGATGQSLYRLITGLSGEAVTDYATKVSLTTTGQTLGAKIDSVSGWAASAANLTATGATLLGLITAASAGVSSLNGASGALSLVGAGNVSVTTAGQVITVSGNTGDYATFATRTMLTDTGVLLGGRIDTLTTNLATSGSNLYRLITGLSGEAVTDYATKVNVTLTGQTLGAKVDSVSGWAASAANLGATGSVLDGRITTVATNLTLTGQTLGAKVDSVSGWAASAVNLAATGSSLYVALTGLSGQHNADFATKASLALTGQQAWAAATNNAINLSGNLTSTGVQLGARIAATGQSLYALLTGTSGQAVIDYATKGSLASTGQQAWSAANNNGINLSGALTQTGVQLAATFSVQIAATGQSLYTLVTGLSGQAVLDYATKVALASTGQQAWSAAQNNAVNISGNLAASGTVNAATYATIANLQATGQALYLLTTGLSGQVALDFATKVALASTGQQAWVAGQNNALNISGALAASGAALIARENGISGALQAQIPVITVTGSAPILAPNFSGLGGTLVIQSGNQILISGAGAGSAPAAAGGVTSLNTLTGALTIYGTGGIVLTTGANGIAISGQSASVQFFVTGVPTGSDNFYVTFPTAFGSTPVILPTLQITGSTIHAVAFSEPSNTGFRAQFTNTVLESVSLNVYAVESGGFFGGVGGGGGAGDVTAAQLAATGQQAWTAANSNGINLSGALTATGGLLSAVSVTGSAVINAPDFTGIGGAIVYVAGNTVVISGGAGGSSGPAIFTKGGVFYNPDGLASGIQRTVGWMAPFACTATAVRGYVLNVSGSAAPCTATVNAIRNSALDLLSADLNVNATGAWVSTSTLQNTAFDVGDSLWFNVSNAVNGPASVAIQVDFTKP